MFPSELSKPLSGATSPAQHRIWDVRDVVRIITEQLPDKHSCALAALVCKALCEPSLDALWKNLDSPRPLLQLFSSFGLRQVEPELTPPGVGARANEHDEQGRQEHAEDEGQGDDESDDEDEDEDMEEDGCILLYQLGDIHVAEWDRFERYTQRVRSISFKNTHYIHWVQVVPRLSACTGEQPFLPTLSKVHFQDLKWKDCLALRKALPSSLKSLRIVIPSSPHPDSKTIGEADALSDLMQTMPHLRCIKISGMQEPESFEALRLYTHLTEIQLRTRHALNVEDWLWLSSLSGLTKLTLSLYDDTNSAPISPGFASLRFLNLTGFIRVVTQILHSVTSSTVENLIINCTSSHHPEQDSDLEGTLHTIASRFSNSLRSIGITTTIDPNRLDRNDSLLQQVQPLLRLRSLENFSIHVSPASIGQLLITLSNDDLLSMVKAWPNITHLSLSFIKVHSCVSSRGLTEFVRHSPRLTSLSLPHVDLSDLGPIDTDPLLAHGLSRLSMGMAQADISDPERVAHFLDHLFPNLDLNYLFREGVHSGTRYHGWWRVSKLLEGCQGKRKHSR